MQCRVYVKARILVDEQGSITPISINYQGEQYKIGRLCTTVRAFCTEPERIASIP